MGQIVFAAATVHAPQLFTYPPSEDKAQLDADIAAMRELGKNLDEIKPDAVMVIGSDHLETFFLSAVPTFAVVGGEKSKAAFARKSYALPIHGFTEEILNDLVADGFDLTYSQDAELGHAFAAVYEWVIEGRSLPVIPVFVNTYLPPLPTARRCAQLGAAIRDAILKSPYRIAIVASGGMSHYPGAWKYPQPAFDFDWWAIAHMERGNNNALLELTNEQLDEVGNTEMLPWMILFGAIGQQPGELITYQPTWHHGHAVMRFIPNKKGIPTTPEPAAKFNFGSAEGYQFYRHPDPSVYPLNKLLYDLRFSQTAAPPLVREHAGSGVRVRSQRKAGPGARNHEGRKHRRGAIAQAASAGGGRRASARHVDVAHHRASRAAPHARRTSASTAM